jgi:hypothetical protein
LCIISFIVSVLFCVAFALMIRIGAVSSPLSSLVADLDACPLPCWRGITPRETTLAEAQNLLEIAGYERQPTNRFFENPVVFTASPTSDCVVRLVYNQQMVEDIVLTRCPQLRIGDVMTILGEPDGFVAANILSFRRATVFVEIVGRRTCATPFSPRTLVENIFVMAVDFPVNSRTQSVDLSRLKPWLGFMRGAHYIAREQVAGC